MVDKRRIREMKHAARVKYLDFTPAMIVALALVVVARYLAIITGDAELYIFAGMLAAAVISARVFLFRGAGKANWRNGTAGGPRWSVLPEPGRL
ncbi:MAG: hypothetical protein MUF78_12100 [Candidatus Edwardsbacteria bacterium]|nr:hypothetical protein [Candidatus Edwardsbacteria bacterium]